MSLARSLYGIFCVGLLALLSSSIAAQRLHVHQYDDLDGLPSRNVHGVEQALDGRMWFSTRLGICTYDGARWAKIESPALSAPGLLESGGDGALWVMPRNGPLVVARYHQGEWAELPECPERVSDYGLFALAGIDLETVFVGARDVGLIGFVDGEWSRYALGETIDCSVFALVVRERQLFIGASSGLWRLDLDDLSAAPVAIDSVPSGPVLGLLSDGGSIVAAGNDWLGSLDGSEYTPSPAVSAPFVPYLGPIRLSRDLRGGLYLGHVNRLAYLDRNGRFSSLDPKSGLIGQGALDMTADREGNTWVVGLRGVSKVVNGEIETFNTVQGLFDNEVSAILALDDREVLLGHNGGITRMRPGSTDVIDLNAGPVRGRVMGFERAGDGTPVVACTGLGVGLLTPGNDIRWLPLPTGTQLHAVVRDGDKFWVATINGLFQLQGGEYRAVEGHPLFRCAVRRLALASDGTLYCASMANGLFCRHPDGTVEQWRAGMPEVNRTFTVLLRDGECPLVGTEAGLYEARDGGLFSSVAYPVDIPCFLLSWDEQRQSLWVGTGRGVAHINDGKTRWIGPHEGLAGSEANRDAGYVDDEGRFWVGTDSGLSIVGPELRYGAAPTVSFLDAIYSDEEFAVDGGPFMVGDPGGPLVMRFRATSFCDEEMTRFRYLLEGASGDWVGPSLVPARQLVFPALAAGTYRLHLQAINADGRESAVIISSSITIPAALYERWWFRLALMSLVIWGVWAFVAQRVHRAYAQKLEDQVRSRTTQLRDSERLLESDRERLTAMLTSIADGVAATDGAGRVIMWNSAAEQITGQQVGDVLGQSLHAVLGVDDPFLALGVTQFERTSGSDDPRIIEASTAPLANSGVVVAFRDVTSRLQVERELSRTQRLESLGLLAGGIAHDFNNYLTVVIGTLGMLREESSLSSGQRDQVSVAEQTMSRAVSLTRQLLTFSTGGAPVRQAVDVEGLVQDAVAFALSGSNLASSIKLAPDLRHAHADPGQIAQVLHNLLLNARQVMPDGGAVAVRCYNLQRDAGDGLDVGDEVVIEVADDGPGILAERQLRIFDPFFSSREGGTGLGLAIAHSIISRHGGKISVESTLGRGACFQMILPAIDAISVADQSSPGGGGVGPLRVLVMDDDESICAMLSQMLQHLGHRYMVVKEGDSAVRAYREAAEVGDPFDVVLLDLTIIGGMGGRETAQQLLQLDSQAPLVAASGYSNDTVLGNYAKYGFRAAMAKPFGVDELRGVLTLMVGSE